jgi:hypothetical protein
MNGIGIGSQIIMVSGQTVQSWQLSPSPFGTNLFLLRNVVRNGYASVAADNTVNLVTKNPSTDDMSKESLTVETVPSTSFIRFKSAASGGYFFAPVNLIGLRSMVASGSVFDAIAFAVTNL